LGGIGSVEGHHAAVDICQGHHHDEGAIEAQLCWVLNVTSCDVTIRNRLGLHARAAAKFVHLATRFRAHIHVSRDGRVMDGKSIMGILLLAAACGSTITIAADGTDEEEALTALCQLVDSGFGEDTWNA
jgi:phosphocarrier protein HPr